MENQQHIERLFRKYLDNNCSPEEATVLLRLMRSAEHQTYLQHLIDNQLHDDNGADAANAETIKRIFSKLNLDESATAKNSKTRKIYRIIVGAAVFLIFATAAFILRRASKMDDRVEMVHAAPHDILPGGNRATLKLANGQTIILSQEQAGIRTGDDITYFDGTSIISGHEEKGKPRADNEHAESQPHMLILTTPRGGTYQIQLPDGTLVWLNAASNLTYPKHFDDDQRVVLLDGEAYFDIKQQVRDGRKTPFKVISKNQVVEVFGTQFNVSAYADEPETRTTLIEGHVRVTDAGGSPVTLLPGQQAKAGPHGIRLIQANVESAIDWKNGDFVFDDDNLESIMRKVARWYDIEVSYQGPIREETYGGQISRQKNLSEILRILALSGSGQFNVEDSTVYVKP